MWRWFSDPALRSRYLPEQHEALGREYVASLRATAGRRPTDPRLRAPVDGLTASSAEFRAIWARQEVAVRRTTLEVLSHPQVGRLELQCSRWSACSAPRPFPTAGP